MAYKKRVRGYRKRDQERKARKSVRRKAAQEEKEQRQAGEERLLVQGRSIEAVDSTGRVVKTPLWAYNMGF